jgi:FlaA1/EpsC-like NDP-sugar epimerase
MGEPVRIAEVAHQLVAQAAQPVEIVYTGLRAGEKLHEDRLGTGEVDLRPRHPLISQIAVPALAIEEVSSMLARGDGVGLVASLRLLCEQTSTRSPAQSPAGASAFASRPDSFA